MKKFVFGVAAGWLFTNAAYVALFIWDEELGDALLNAYERAVNPLYKK